MMTTAGVLNRKALSKSRTAQIICSTLMVAATLVWPVAVQAGSPKTLPQAWFVETPEEISSRLAGACADRGGSVVEQDNFHVLCQKTADGLKGAMAQVLVGNAYSTTPEVKVRFSIIKGPQTRVIASQWLETQMAFGQIRKVDLNNRKQHASLESLLAGIGGSLTLVANRESLQPSAP